VAAPDSPGRIDVRSSLRLFLSLDIVGSTEFKQASRSADAPRAIADAWVEPFLSFYQISVEQMEAHWVRTCGAMSAVEPSNKSERFLFGTPPQFWKGAGDEVLFSKEVRSPLDAMAAIHTFLSVMKEHRARFAQKGVRLDVKGTAWLAGFPVNNAKAMLAARYEDLPPGRLDEPVAENYRLLALYRAGDAKTFGQLDYVGPSVDLGFRLREHATPRRLVVSADLVWLLCHTHDSCTDRERKRCRFLTVPHVGYDGRRGLKGILGGQPYPLLWIEADPDNEIDRAEDAVLRRPLPGHTPGSDRVGHVSRFCDLFLNGRTALQARPYIGGCGDPEISIVPPEHKSRLESIESHVNGARDQLDALAVEDGGSGPIPADTQAFAETLAWTMGARTMAARGKPRPSKPGKRKSRR
jgi:hypothetical protein